jgi:hypothetical protein
MKISHKVQVLHNRKQQRIQSRHRIFLLMSILFVLVTCKVMLMGGWLPFKQALYLEVDPVMQPFPQIYGVATVLPLPAPFWLKSILNRYKAHFVARSLGFTHLTELSMQALSLSNNLSGTWVSQVGLISQEEGVVPQINERRHRGVVGKYYFFNEKEVDQLALLYLQGLQKRPLKLKRTPWWKPLPIINQTQVARTITKEQDGLVSVLVLERNMTKAMQLSPHTTVLNVARSVAEEAGYEGFILLTYQYLRQDRLVFDVALITHDTQADMLTILGTMGHGFTSGDVIWVNPT